MAGKKIIPFPGKYRGVKKPRGDQPDPLSTGELQRGRREDHTQKRYVPEAMNLTLVIAERWKPKKKVSGHKSGGRARRRSPSILRLNSSNVKRKPKARGRTR